jgi:hypothetical protein
LFDYVPSVFCHSIFNGIRKGVQVLEKAKYEIAVEGLLDARWSEWFEGWTVTPHENGITILTSLPIDQAALHGLLTKIRDLNISLLSVQNMKHNSAITKNRRIL